MRAIWKGALSFSLVNIPITRREELKFHLLREALKKTGKVGIARVVIKTRQHLAAVKSHGNILVLELMHFGEELVKPTQLKTPNNLDVGAKELEMATALIGSMTDRWDPEKYTDEYRSALLKLIHEKIEHGGKLPPGGGPKKRPGTKVIDLVSVLQESLERARNPAAKPSTHRAHARHARKAKKAA